jgi:ribosomal protein L32E
MVVERRHQSHKCKRTREYWVKSPVNVSSEVTKDIKETLMTPGQNYGKDRYTIDLTRSEKTY